MVDFPPRCVQCNFLKIQGGVAPGEDIDQGEITDLAGQVFAANDHVPGAVGAKCGMAEKAQKYVRRSVLGVLEGVQPRTLDADRRLWVAIEH